MGDSVGCSQVPAESVAEVSAGPTMELPYRPKDPQAGHSKDEEHENEANAEPGELDEEGQETVEPDTSQKKKKRKKRSRGGKAKKKATGFEEYYVDPPITPAEYEEERKIYDISIPAVKRLETAIQHYQVKRRLDSDRRYVFTKYMSYGGVDVGPKMFEGNDPRNVQDMNGEDIITAMADANIPDDRSEKYWVVDFELVAKGFFSSTLPDYFGLETKKLVDLATSTVKNFLNYSLYHKVCPEYEQNIFSARAVCDVANKELWKTQQIRVWAPGDFNMACSTLFGGSYFDAYTGNAQWVNNTEDGTAGMPNETARKVVKFALAGAGSYEQAVRFRDLANTNTLKGKKIDEYGFEVVAVTPPTPEIKDFYHQHAPDLKPVGRVRARPWRDPGIPDEDLAPGETHSYLYAGDDDDDVEEVVYSSSTEYEFFIEETILESCFVGMKVAADVWQLNCGMHYFDKVLGVYCSFYTVLPNESMLGWKKPRDLRTDEVACDDGKIASGAETSANLDSTIAGSDEVADQGARRNEDGEDEVHE